MCKTKQKFNNRQYHNLEKFAHNPLLKQDIDIEKSWYNVLMHNN